MKRTCTTSTTSRRAFAWAAPAAVAVLLAAASAPSAGWAARGAAGEPAAARAVIVTTVDRVLAILRDATLSDDAKRAKLEDIANDRFDFETMARLVMGRNWKRLDDAQREEFVAEFRTYLANDYGERLQRYDQEDVKVLGEEPRPRGDVVVATKIVGGENDGALVDYRMRRRNHDWRIIDVVIEGVSLVANFRDQFREVVSSGGPEDLLRKLREKNAEHREAS